MSGGRNASWARRHSLSLVLMTIWLSFTFATLLLGHAKWRAEGEGISFWLWWWYEYSMSLVADCFGALALVVLNKRLREDG